MASDPTLQEEEGEEEDGNGSSDEEEGGEMEEGEGKGESKPRLSKGACLAASGKGGGPSALWWRHIHSPISLHLNTNTNTHTHINTTVAKRRQALALPEYDAAGLAGLDREALKYRIGLLEQVRLLVG